VARSICVYVLVMALSHTNLVKGYVTSALAARASPGTPGPRGQMALVGCGEFITRAAVSTFLIVLALIEWGASGEARPKGPVIIQIYRDFLRPGTEARYRDIEQDAARTCERLHCPNPYLAVESLTGPSEVWFLNGFLSRRHEADTANAYQGNSQLQAALDRLVLLKADLVLSPVITRATLRPDLSGGEPWRFGSRLLVVSVARSDRRSPGTVFEAGDGSLLVLGSAVSPTEAKAKAGQFGDGARVFAVRPSMSMPAPQWVEADRDFWRVRP
jgi:hypothetical protein